ncbi:MAG: DNA recombination protein RmuC [Planctomycetes bacterium]|nr:DNA recombination protein RmuC [Planctomycetota bacterium]
MEWLLAALAGLAVGGLISYLVARAPGRLAEQRAQAAEQERAAAEQRAQEASQALNAAQTELAGIQARLEVEQRNAVELQKRFDAQAQEHREQLRKLGDELGEKFKLHADAALKQQESGFLERAGKKLAPFEQQLESLRLYTAEVEKQRHADKGQLLEQLGALGKAADQLRGQSESLATALRGSSKARGEWGEVSLKNLVELAGMSQHCDFSEQVVAADGQRPDMVINLPGGEKLPVDVKVALTAFWDGMDAESDADRDRFFLAHSRKVRERAKDLARKSYADQLEGGIDYVVMFLPGEQFLDAAIRYDKNLLVDAARDRVLIATPVTFLALLKTVQLIWRNEAAAKNAREILQTAQELYKRASKFGEHLGSLGKSLGTAVDRYEKTRASFEKRLLPMGRQLERLLVSEQQGQEMQLPQVVDPPSRIGSLDVGTDEEAEA